MKKVLMLLTMLLAPLTTAQPTQTGNAFAGSVENVMLVSPQRRRERKDFAEVKLMDNLSNTGSLCASSAVFAPLR